MGLNQALQAQAFEIFDFSSNFCIIIGLSFPDHPDAEQRLNNMSYYQLQNVESSAIEFVIHSTLFLYKNRP